MASPSGFSQPEGGGENGSIHKDALPIEQCLTIPLCETGSKYDDDEYSFSCRLCTCEEADIKGEAALMALGIQSKGSRLIRTKSRRKLSFPRSMSFKSVRSLLDPEGGRATAGNSSQPAMGEGVVTWGPMTLGCACRSELALAHYACALRWFLIRGSTQCEICGKTASNISEEDIRTLAAALLEHHHVPRSRHDGLVGASEAAPQASTTDTPSASQAAVAVTLEGTEGGQSSAGEPTTSASPAGGSVPDWAQGGEGVQEVEARGVGQGAGGGLEAEVGRAASDGQLAGAPSDHVIAIVLEEGPDLEQGQGGTIGRTNDEQHLVVEVRDDARGWQWCCWGRTIVNGHQDAGKRKQVVVAVAQWFDPSDRGPRASLQWIHVLQKWVGERPLSALPRLDRTPQGASIPPRLCYRRIIVLLACAIFVIGGLYLSYLSSLNMAVANSPGPRTTPAPSPSQR